MDGQHPQAHGGVLGVALCKASSSSLIFVVPSSSGYSVVYGFMPWEELSWGHAGLPFTELQGLFVLGEYSAEIPLPIGAPKPFPCSKCLCPPKAWPRTQTLMKTLPDTEQLPCLFSQDFHETVNMSNMSFISKTIFSHFFFPVLLTI